MQVSTLGIWPFDSEAENNLDASISAAGVLLEKAANLSLLQTADLSTADLTGNPWENFIRHYMEVEKAVGAPYTDNANFYTVWEPRLTTYGYAQSTLEALMAAWRGLINAGQIAPEVVDPAHVAPPGNKDTPAGNLFGAVGSGVQTTLFGLAGIAVAGLIGYKLLTRAGK